jgi:hypothetical protein
MDTPNSSTHDSKVAELADEKIENIHGDEQLYDDSVPKSKAEKRLLLKQDLIILPLLSLTFFFAYLVMRNASPCLEDAQLTRH